MAGELTPAPYMTGFNASPGGAHSEGQRANRKRFGDIIKSGYHFVAKKPARSEGAYAYAFESLGLVEFTPIGPGVAQRFSFSLTAPQLYIGGQALPTQGLGGVVPGNIVLQPLIDPYSGYGGGQ